MVKVHNPELMSAKEVTDERGTLTVFELGKALPFKPKRIFIISKAPVGISRGGHAHRRCSQFLIATSGEIQVTVTNRNANFNFNLNSNQVGLFLPALNWVEFIFNAPNTTATVLASRNFEESDYIYDRNKII
jgi:UDP-2-acetamido-3-amino-2,3-dideoxy-glucuronate N-acetyltransferase